MFYRLPPNFVMNVGGSGQDGLEFRSGEGCFLDFLSLFLDLEFPGFCGAAARGIFVEFASISANPCQNPSPRTPGPWAVFRTRKLQHGFPAARSGAFLNLEGYRYSLKSIPPCMSTGGGERLL